MGSLLQKWAPSSRNGFLFQKMIFLSTLISLPNYSGEMGISKININKRNIYKWKLIFYYLSYIGISR
jgi:hypothetical protein